MSLRARQTLALVPSVVRALNWLPLLPASALALLLVGLVGGGAGLSLDQLLAVLRVAAFALCMAAAYSLDDTAAVVTAAVPAPLVQRRLLRAVLVAIPVAALWAVAVWLASRKQLASPDSLPLAGVSLEAATLLALTLALAAGVARLLDSEAPGHATAALLLSLMVTSVLVPMRWWPWVSPDGDPGQHRRWVQVHRLWSAALIASVTCFLWLSRTTYPSGRSVRPRRAPSTRQPARAAQRQGKQ